MSATKLATRYAKALIDLAKEQNQLELVQADVVAFAEATKQRDFYMLLKSPIIDFKKKQQIVNAIFGDKFNKTTLAFINLICGKSREEYLPEISAAFLSQYKEMQGISSVKITTATQLDEAGLEAIKQKLIATNAISANVDVTTAVNADLIGGFVLEFDGKQYDASVANQLYKLKDKFDDNDYINQIMAR